MRISNAEVSMASQASYSRSEKVEHSTTINPCINLNGIQLIKTDNSKSNEGIASFSYCLDKKGQLSEVDSSKPASSSSSLDNMKVRMNTLSYLLRYLLFGEKMNGDSTLSELWNEAFSSSNQMMITDEMTVSYEESQQVSFSAQGSVMTEDGRELKFNYSFEMSSSFKAEYKEVSQWMQQMSLVDPLVVHLDSNPKEISDQRFYFDLDCDGEEEEISTLGGGRGFLALDLNDDGKINDGSELFGVKSGDGFADLAIYDEDGNGWIDENDSIFDRLRVWTVNENGEEELYTLKQSDVGAICLSKVNTNFVSHGDNHETMGVIRKSGFFLHESTGKAGAVQHIDLAT